MKHHATPGFCAAYKILPLGARKAAEKSFSFLKSNPRHPSLHLKKVGRYWSARSGLNHRTLGVDAPDGILWIWIGTHEEYDELIG